MSTKLGSVFTCPPLPVNVYSKMSSEVEETLKRLVSHKGVIGTIVVNNDGIPIKSTLDNHTTTQYAGLINQLVDQVKVLKILFYQNNFVPFNLIVT